MSTASSPSPWQAAPIELPHGHRSWTVLDAPGEIVDCCRRWIVYLEQTHAPPNTIRAYVPHVVEFANFLSANGAGLHQATLSLYDSFLVWRLATRKDALPSPRLVLLERQATRIFAPATRNHIQLLTLLQWCRRFRDRYGRGCKGLRRPSHLQALLGAYQPAPHGTTQRPLFVR